MKEDRKGMSISELSRLSGMARHTIHYYVRTGILHPPAKVGRTRAIYDASHLEQLRMIRKIRQDYDSPLAFVMSQFQGGADEAGGPGSGSAPAGGKGASPPARDVNAERKRRIMDVAIELFSTKGFHKSSVKDVADRAGTSVATFYGYFESKQDLFNEVVVELVRTTVARLERTLIKEEDFFARNTRRLQALSEYHWGFSEILTQLRTEMYSDESRARESLKQVYYEMTRPFVFEIRQAFAQKVIRPVDPDLLTFALIGLCDILLFRLSLDDRYDLQQVIGFLFDILLTGLKPEEDASPGPDTGLAEVSTLTVEELDWLTLLREADYNLAKAARKMGKTRQAVSNYLRRHPKLREAIAREKARGRCTPGGVDPQGRRTP